jgi:hypothetical protein
MTSIYDAELTNSNVISSSGILPTGCLNSAVDQEPEHRNSQASTTSLPLTLPTAAIVAATAAAATATPAAAATKVATAAVVATTTSLTKTELRFGKHLDLMI